MVSVDTKYIHKYTTIHLYFLYTISTRVGTVIETLNKRYYEITRILGRYSDNSQYIAHIAMNYVVRIFFHLKTNYILSKILQVGRPTFGKGEIQNLRTVFQSKLFLIRPQDRFAPAVLEGKCRTN